MRGSARSVAPRCRRTLARYSSVISCRAVASAPISADTRKLTSSHLERTPPDGCCAVVWPARVDLYTHLNVTASVYTVRTAQYAGPLDRQDMTRSCSIGMAPHQMQVTRAGPAETEVTQHEHE